MKRKYPKTPLSSAGGIIFNDEKCVLLIHRKRPPHKGKWSLPGGVIQIGEKIDKALRREVYEECMVHIEVGPLISVSSKIIKTSLGKTLYHFIIRDYLCRYKGGRPDACSDAKTSRG